MSAGRTLLIVAAAAVLAAAEASAQRDPATERGFSPDKAYQVGEVDQVSLFNGNLSLTIPIGGSYPVNASSYGLTLIYNSSVWDLKGVFYGDVPLTRADPCQACNAGLGFILSFGQLLAPDDPTNSTIGRWLYIAPDGSEHAFYDTLHQGEPVVSGYSYTRDSSYIRMKTTAAGRDLQFGDGTVRSFQSSGGKWRISSIADAYGSGMTVTYPDSTTWIISDTLGRSHAVHFNPTGSVGAVVVQGFGGQSVSYLFDYQRRAVSRSCRDNDPVSSETVTVDLLRSITLPDGSTWSDLTYNEVPCPAASKDLPGTLSGITLPTLGRIEWGFQDWEHWSCEADPKGFPILKYSVAGSAGVATRRTHDSSGALLGTWTYTPHTQYSVADQWGCTQAQQRITEVGDPLGNATLSYASAERSQWHYGLSYSPTEAPDGGGRGPAAKMYRGDPTVFCPFEMEGGACTITGGTLERTQWVRYEHDLVPTGSVPSADRTNSNRRAASERLVYNTDNSRDVVTDRFDFDGLGHYRTTVVAGHADLGPSSRSFTNHNGWAGTYKLSSDGSAYDTSSADPYTQFPGNESPGHSFSSKLPSGWPTSKPWLLGSFDHEQQDRYDETASPALASSRQDACFEKDSGGTFPARPFVRTRRTRKSAASASGSDVVVQLTRDAYGQVIRERHFGGDLQSISTAAICSWSPPAVDQYSINHGYPYASGVWNGLRRTWYGDASNASLGFYTLDQDIDFGTGLVAAERDTAGLPTAFSYDGMGRLTWIMPTGQAPGAGAVPRGVWIQHCYFNASGSAFAKVEVLSRPNSVTASCTDISNVLARSSYTYDGLGRLAGEYTRLPGGAWSQRLHGYNAMGWKEWETEWQPSGTTTLSKTVSSGFDPFGRPTTITPPDGSAHAVTLSYKGERQVRRTVKVGTSRSGNVVTETSAVTTSSSDRHGRLWQVTEPSGSTGSNVTTTYTYDPAGRLSRASTTSGITQVREWSFDGRGFLVSETVPEKGGTGGYGTISYSFYDARGNPGRVVDGPNDLSSTYDRAGRLVRVAETATGKALKSYTYGTSNSPGNLANGKLLVAEAGNFYDATNNFQFRESSSYGGTDGRLSQRVTLGGIVGGNQASFTLGTTWTELGDPSTVSYPQKAGVGPSRTITNTYSYGLLTSVTQGGTSVASSITYHPNATVNRITYGNGTWLDLAEDPYDMARPSRITLSNASSPWDTGVFGYDGAGNITTMTGASSTDTFVYDKVSRIREARVMVSGAVKTQGYTYDSFGNLTTITTNGSTRSLAVDASNNRISGAGYDGAGSMTSWGSGTTTYGYAYYPTNQVKQVTGDGRVTLHGYSAEGERVGTFDSVVGGITYVLRGLDDKPLRQYRESGGVWTWQKDWVWRDGLLLATIEPSGTKYFHLDHLGTPRRITNSSRTIIASHDYYPFGEEITSSSQDAEVMKFTGHERDLRDATRTTDDLDYMHARYHNPNLARFLTVDPAGGDPAQPQSWNRYSYVRNNPVKYKDPTGRYEEDVHRDLTAALAQAAGFDVATANAIAAADQWMDDNPETVAISSLEARRDHHFTSQERRDEMWAAFQSDPSAGTLGAFLHAQQDSFSHAGFSKDTGHVRARHGPDKTFNDVEKANRMAADTYAKLVKAAGIMGVSSTRQVPYSKIAPLVGGFNAVKTDLVKAQMILEIQRLVKQSNSHPIVKSADDEKSRGGR